MIEFKNLSKSIDGNLILDSIDLQIKKGSVFGLLGSNGAGKSTILRLMCGIYKQESGELLIDGEKVYDNVKIKRQIFFINDETVQFTSFTLKDLKKYYKNYYPNFSDETFEKLRKIVNLPVDKKISTFSKGMKRQAIVITGLSCQTEYLLLDEAFDGLDPTMRIIVKDIIFDAMLDRQMTVIISSHNLKEINEICDSAAMIHNGKIIFCRELDEIKNNILKIQTSFKQEYTKDDFPELEILHFEKKQSVYYIIVKGEIDEIKKYVAQKSPAFLDILPLTLEEIFIYEMEALGYNANGIETNQ